MSWSTTSAVNGSFTVGDIGHLRSVTGSRHAAPLLRYMLQIMPDAAPSLALIAHGPMSNQFRRHFGSLFSLRDLDVACVSVRDLELGGDVNPAKTSSTEAFSSSRCYQSLYANSYFGWATTQGGFLRASIPYLGSGKVIKKGKSAPKMNRN
jgi:hypothetical protein